MSHPSRLTAIMRGLKHRCPECGEAPLYRKYLKVADECGGCRHPLGGYRADDGPAYVTILLVGHIVIAPLMFFPWIWEASPWLTVPATLIPLLLVTLLLLPRVKGGFVGLLYSLKLHGDHGVDEEFAASDPPRRTR